MLINLTQHQIRQHAIQALFTIEARSDEKADRAIAYTFDDAEEDNPTYLKDLVLGVLDNQKEIDLRISHYLTLNWSLSRLTNIDRTILRLAVYEILKTETPNVVAIDEALNLAHDFSDDTAVKLINGILTNLIKE